jgi:hypothetical protein
MPKDKHKRDLRFRDLGILDECICYGVNMSTFCGSECPKTPDGSDLRCRACSQYRTRCLPATVQLAEKMRKRGKRVDPGSRVEYVITEGLGITDNLFNKIEDPEYQKRMVDFVKLDYMYYLHLMINPIDEALQVAYGIEGFLKKHYKLRLQKYKYVKHIASLNSIFIYDKSELR